MEASLYRKYRPGTFSELIGQDIIKKALTNQIKTGKVSHAYLFTGSRGTGKTSAARILAKALNCEHPVDGSPCGKCAQCQGAGSTLDIIEMDAASNNGVDYIRELRDDVAYLPSSGKYKTYIIDEVHMLSASAYNALLKTLEEPPAHVIFVLCTTNPEKISATILSRCMRFDFKLVSNAELEQHLGKIFKAEGIKADPDAIRHIAKLGEGSVRDTLSIADRCITVGEELTLENVLEITGTGRTGDCEALLTATFNSDTGEIIRKIEELSVRGKTIASVSNDLSGFARDVMLVKATGENAAGLSGDNFEKMKTLADKIPYGFLLSLVRELGKADVEIRYSLSPKTVLECALLSLCSYSSEETSRAYRQPGSPSVKKSRGEILAYVGKIRKTLDEEGLMRLGGIMMNMGEEDFDMTADCFIINTGKYYDILSSEANRRELMKILEKDGLGLIINKREEEKHEGIDLDEINSLGLPVQEISGRKKQ